MLRDVIRECYLFSNIDEGSLDLLTRLSTIARYEAESAIFAAGDEPDGLRVIITGSIRIWISDAEGRELTLALLEPGDPFGEISVLDKLPRTANASALANSECLFLPKDAMEIALDKSPQFAHHLIQLLCEILRRNTEAMGAFAFLGLDGRLAQKLLDLALSYADLKDDGAKFKRKFSQNELAHMLGVTREALNKRLNALAHDGLITLTNGLISIPNLEALATRARAAERLNRGR
ncbi:cAMP-binding protein - catabolite gene activator and regulatory subunit of cAMP-dependent protein kinase [Roseibium aggregatum IAM 12614]|uniref:cAMP-binding protein-catabolite gene activator and regulatory subunit of cAMP-dependent protein kinase n=1 Tax=Roseibium aggregatum (strain ATCC 25650 / DSM 13394 / JCM 20685 / NBRC 16684 / NCIMB 2208 / IAM 12614 / B1) TaxID=384765 RepID=A0NZG3_ROSAI|nr:Crp/Fnr family transcriptional regulator [Roseibium aggregatum]EAV41842.1 cAMP-binding protein - catabolite gene activator and regulatory subunit of cAMP-dependent protein kinase [Roseibium aggregatum IAM 12614]